MKPVIGDFWLVLLGCALGLLASLALWEWWEWF